MLKVTKLNRTSWKVLDNWDARYAVVPADFVSNGANIPWWLRWLMRPAGDLFEAAVLHDYCYVYAIKSKQFADKSFYMTALYYNCPKWKAKLAYLTVKYVGRGNY